MITWNSERLISLTEAAKVLPGRPHISSIFRWISTGAKGIKLETIVCAGRRFTSLEAIERFIAATTAAAAGEPPPSRTPRQRERAIEEAERKIREKA